MEDGADDRSGPGGTGSSSRERVGFKEDDGVGTQHSLEATPTPTIPKGVKGAGEPK